MNKKNTRLAGAGMLSAIAASLCCITPVLALISGASGIASAFSWMEPARPYLIAITLLVLGFAWYQKLKPRTANEIQCACEENEKQSFGQTKTFLGITTALAILMLAFPYYAHIFYTSNQKKEIMVVNSSNIQTLNYDISGMTCNACASHVENNVNKLPGIIQVNASYKDATVNVEFDQSKINPAQIENAINETGYKISRKIDGTPHGKAGHICGPNGCE
ncbi:mercuric transport protein MerTP [Elizabethkingia anophelis]|uniref:mercuric transport protein MerTP n=1 Tax=Elizabethkingia anophelis TaxID=1117645 RepID=UPI0016294AA6|nr:mercuric transport protein MerTP [Elizabethkingia anophelis]MDV4116285.1 heavy metal transporter [Elizabethkingia anophelis]